MLGSKSNNSPLCLSWNSVYYSPFTLTPLSTSSQRITSPRSVSLVTAVPSYLSPLVLLAEALMGRDAYRWVWAGAAELLPLLSESMILVNRQRASN